MTKKKSELLSHILSIGFSRQVINSGLNSGWLKKNKKRCFRDSYSTITEVSNLNKKITLNNEQKKVYNEICKSLEKNENRVFLLHGITGSGKTEVYMQLAMEVKNNSKQTIVLVPEISLTGQMVERFKSRFFNRVGVIHSKISASERADVFEQSKNQSIDIIIGARSAIFTPTCQLGLIIIDEEQEFSYKQEERPYYNAKQIAQWRASSSNIPLIFGTATPSIEIYYKALTDNIRLLPLKKRPDQATLPEVQIVDLCKEFNKKNRTVISEKLKILIQSTLLKKEQTIVLLNRRGYSTFVICRECGHVMTCIYCDVSLTYHNNTNILKCHYCGYFGENPLSCPNCKGKYIRYFGTGTQKVEEQLKKLFPTARILRMDQDTTKGKFGHEKKINDFKSAKFDILVGTQMVAKGHDISNVSLVGIISADTCLNFPDFRASEKTFALLAQASGRAGRGQIKGNVLIQTYNPNHYSILAAANHDYETFFYQEIQERKELGYPPLEKIFKISLQSNNQEKGRNQAKDIVDKIKRTNRDIKIVGPIQPLITKIKSYYRYLILIKSKDEKILRICIKNTAIDKMKNIDIDVSPISIM